MDTHTLVTEKCKRILIDLQKMDRDSKRDSVIENIVHCLHQLELDMKNLKVFLEQRDKQFRFDEEKHWSKKDSGAF